MDLISGYPYFLLKNGLLKDYGTLQSDHATEVIVLGGGISGALMAYYLVKNGIACTVIDKRKIGLGSTSASTSLLQYEIDVPLHRLSAQIGRSDAVQAYKLCSNAIDALSEISREIGYNEFVYCNSVYFSPPSSKSDFLKKEFDSRKEAGFAVKYIDRAEIKRCYGLLSQEAIVSEQAAKIDAYRFTHLLHDHNLKKGVTLFENTCAQKTEEHKQGVTLTTDKGFRVNAKKIIYATGYEVTDQIAKKIVSLQSTFALVTEPVHELPPVFEKTLFWNTSSPYLYLREDAGRLIIGGKDDRYNPVRRERLLEKKAKNIEADFRKIFPQVDLKTQFTWAGTFGSTKDGLPYIGMYSKKPRLPDGQANSYFALGFGGNGITFSAVAAAHIAQSIQKGANVVPPMFRFDR